MPIWLVDVFLSSIVPMIPLLAIGVTLGAGRDFEDEPQLLLVYGGFAFSLTMSLFVSILQLICLISGVFFSLLSLYFSSIFPKVFERTKSTEYPLTVLNLTFLSVTTPLYVLYIYYKS